VATLKSMALSIRTAKLTRAQRLALGCQQVKSGPSRGFCRHTTHSSAPAQLQAQRRVLRTDPHHFAWFVNDKGLDKCFGLPMCLTSLVHPWDLHGFVYTP
jgi:hypothetical protein